LKNGIRNRCRPSRMQGNHHVRYKPRVILLGGSGVFDLSPVWYALRIPSILLAVFGLTLSVLSLTRFKTAEWLPLAGLGVKLWGLAFVILLIRGGLVLAAVLSALVCVLELGGYIRRRKHYVMAV